ncbi:MAG: hypothetical protein GY906_12590 [bacterium]|nr:hypothetical protein [bacterium]
MVSSSMQYCTAKGAAVFGVVLLVLISQLACGSPKNEQQQVIVLGFDGMDWDLTQQMINDGKLPAFARLAEQGSLSRLGTAFPPQSPVAWSNFTTGMDAGGHGIFDFIHRDPSTMTPFLSTSRVEDEGLAMTVGQWKIPLGGGEALLLRHGQAFWEVLEDKGIESWVIRMPANYPPSGKATVELSGMGTPDFTGSYGTFTYYTSDPFAALSQHDTGGGEIVVVGISDNVITTKLSGPPNPFHVEGAKVTAPLEVFLDSEHSAAKLVIGEDELILSEGEWSEWVTVGFDLIPTQSAQAICRIFLKQVRPTFELYVTPLNLDPQDPAMQISTPSSFASELADMAGPYYTQGMPEDTSALQSGVLTREEFLAQAQLSGGEVIRQYQLILDSFEKGLLFYYFGNGDLVSHMLWSANDPSHPAYDAEADARFASVVEDIYREFDRIVADTLDRVSDDTLVIAMSDHGFSSWKRAFHLNAWLRDNGYLAVIDPEDETGGTAFSNIDWSGTRAYGLGVNGLYVNLKGREAHGIVEPADREALLREIAASLLATIDPETGLPAVTKASLTEEIYRDRGYLDLGPDLIVGYTKATRCSNQSALGSVPLPVIEDNDDAWSADHCMDDATVPGILVTSRPLKRPVDQLTDLAGAILTEFGIEDFPDRSQNQADKPEQTD